MSISRRAGGQLDPVPSTTSLDTCAAGAALSNGAGFPIAPLTAGGDTSALAPAVGQLFLFGTTVAVLEGVSSSA
jgi:hypothetical protein